VVVTIEERLRALERALIREEASLRRARVRVAALLRAHRRLLAYSPQGGATGALTQTSKSAAEPACASSGPSGRQPSGTHQAGPLALDRETNVVLVLAGPGERRVALTPSEAGLLALLMDRPGHVWSCRDLARLALGYDVVGSEAVEIVRPHISRLRQKLEADPLQPRLIRTVRGLGYILSP
jgi:DNA-binding response OmpR family regulator